MEQKLKFKPGQTVRVERVRNASAVGYLGVYLTIYDYEKHPNFQKKDKEGEWLYPCVSENHGDITWWHEDELR